MDSELGRCRRTDGKKWRCSRDVLPDQKYCERHMHRGRHRSRKHVEITERVTKSNSSKTVNSKKTPLSIKPPDNTQKLPAILQPIRHPSSKASYKVCSAATPVSTTCSDSNGSLKMKRSRKAILSNSKSIIVALGSDTAPKSDLGSGIGCDTSTGSPTETPLKENEPKRCKRTDGKNWRCSSEVIPEQKYCVQHIHRGVKKLMAASNPVPMAFSPSPLATPNNLNTGISIHETLTTDNEKSTSGSSSDATTITDDENTSDSSKYIIRARDSSIQIPF